MLFLLFIIYIANIAKNFHYNFFFVVLKNIFIKSSVISDFKMVFENIVANVLNRFLGDFVDNLDPSQLNIGIWGGLFKFFFLVL